MMSKRLRVVTYKELAKKLSHAGYQMIRTSKHPVYYKQEGNITIPVPDHPGDVPKGFLRKIIKEIGIAIEEFNRL